MTLLYIAFDVVQEVFARRNMLVLLCLIIAGLLALTFSLNLEVVEGALAGMRLFGKQLTGAITPVDVALRPIFQALAYATFYNGLLFGIVASADIAPKMLAPGRVELLLSLPVRRVELVLGTYLGVLVVALITTSFAVGGVSLVLFWKAGFVTGAPAVGAVMAVLGFMPIYAVMLFAASLARSAAMSAGAGLMLYLAGVVTSWREEFLSWFRSGTTRAVLEVLIAPIPRLHGLAEVGAQAATDQPVASGVLFPLVGIALAFAGAALVAACFVVSEKNY